MNQSPFLSGIGCAWTFGAAGAASYPASYVGDATTTSTLSIMSKVVSGAQVTQLLGLLIVSTAGPGTAAITGHSSATAMSGLTFDAGVAGVMYNFSNGQDGLLYDRKEHTHGSNFSLKCSAGVTAILFWRRLL